MSSSDFMGETGKTAPMAYDAGELPGVQVKIAETNDGAEWMLSSLQSFLAGKLKFSMGSTVLLRTVGENGCNASMTDDDHVEIFFEAFPKLLDLEVYEVTSAYADKLLNTVTAQVAVSGSTAHVAGLMATVAGRAGPSPFNPPPQKSPSAPSVKPLPNHVQYRQLVELRQNKVQLVEIDKKLAGLKRPSEEAGEALSLYSTPPPIPSCTSLLSACFLLHPLRAPLCPAFR